MAVRSIRALFCNIKQFDINLTEFNALVAPNNYGKSNVLEGIRFAFRFIAATEEERLAMMNDSSFIPINNATSGDAFRFGIELTHIPFHLNGQRTMENRDVVSQTSL